MIVEYKARMFYQSNAHVEQPSTSNNDQALTIWCQAIFVLQEQRECKTKCSVRDMLILGEGYVSL